MDTQTTKYIKPFTKEWWSNTWYYYKWYLIGGIIALGFLIFFLAECVFTVQADFTMTYIGGMEPMGQIDAYQLEDALAPVTEDINSDGNQKVRVSIIYLDRGTQSQEMAANFQMADLEMAGGDSVVFLFDSEYLERYSEYGYYDLTEIAEKYQIPEEQLKRYEDGRVYAVNLAGNPVFEQVEDLKTEDLYLAVRPLRENDRTDWQKKNHENGVFMAEYLLSGGTAAR